MVMVLCKTMNIRDQWNNKHSLICAEGAKKSLAVNEKSFPEPRFFS